MIRVPLWAKVATVVLLVLAARLAYLEWQLERARSDVRELALRTDSLEAELDTTRLVLLSADSQVATWQRRAVQTELERDSIDRALKLRPVVRIAAKVDPKPDTATATVALEDSMRVSSHFDRPAYQAHVEVTIIRDSARIALVVDVKPILLEVRVGCGGAGTSAGHIRTASVALSAPAWATVELGRLEQDPDVCNAELQPNEPGWKTPAKVLAGVGVGVIAGLLLSR